MGIHLSKKITGGAVLTLALLSQLSSPALAQFYVNPGYGPGAYGPPNTNSFYNPYTGRFYRNTMFTNHPILSGTVLGTALGAGAGAGIGAMQSGRDVGKKAAIGAGAGAAVGAGAGMIRNKILYGSFF